MGMMRSVKSLGGVLHRLHPDVHYLGSSRALLVGGDDGCGRSACELADVSLGVARRLVDCPVSVGSSGMVGSRLVVVEAFALDSSGRPWNPAIAWSEAPYSIWHVQRFEFRMIGCPALVALGDACAVVAASEDGLEVYQGTFERDAWHWKRTTYAEGRESRSVAAVCHDPYAGGLWIVASENFDRTRTYCIHQGRIKEVAHTAVHDACSVDVCAFKNGVVLEGGELGAQWTLFQGCGAHGAELGPVSRIDELAGRQLVRVGPNGACTLLRHGGDGRQHLVAIEVAREEVGVVLGLRSLGTTTGVVGLGEFGEGHLLMLRGAERRGGSASLEVVCVAAE